MLLKRGVKRSALAQPISFLVIQELIMNNIKSITTVNTSNGWAVCQSNDDGTELFVIPDVFEPRYTPAQAQLAANSLSHHLENGGRTYAKPLPAGVSIKE